MAKRVDGFFGLPGGFGTLDEVRFAPFIQIRVADHIHGSQILEVITWTQIGFHNKRICFMIREAIATTYLQQP